MSLAVISPRQRGGINDQQSQYAGENHVVQRILNVPLGANNLSALVGG
jgi:hypothetical protein